MNSMKRKLRNGWGTRDGFEDETLSTREIYGRLLFVIQSKENDGRQGYLFRFFVNRTSGYGGVSTHPFDPSPYNRGSFLYTFTNSHKINSSAFE